MTNNLFVGGFPYETTQEQLASFFKACGGVISVKILLDRDTNRSRGLAFVEMSSEAEARAAIAKLNGATLGARKIFVSEARPKDGAISAPADKPKFVERRSGRDRRRTSAPAPAPAPARGEWKKRPAFGGPKKSFADKRSGGGYGDKPSGGAYGEKPRPAGPKRHGDAEGKKKWGAGGPGGGNKWGRKPKKFGGGFGRGGR